MKFLRKKGIKYRKVKVVSKTKLYSFAFITLKSQDDREKAIEILNRSKFRGKELVCKQSIPLPDPLIVKRINQPDSIVDNNYDNLSTNERNKFILDKVCSLWQLPYCDQINRKIDRLQSTFQKCYKTLKTLNNSNLEIMSTLNWFRSFQLKDKFIFSPQTEGYRNKYEFNVGSDNRVGFRLGLYRNGSIKVVNPPDNCPIISSQANLIWKHFQKYLLEKTSLNGYNPITHKGYWRQILVRLNQSNESLISISLTRQPELSDEELEKECENICKHFNEDPKLNIKSIYIDFILNSTYSEKPSKCFRHLTGVTHIFESIKISDNEILKFRISPTSFFQINILAAELLYRKILELAKCTPETILLDICCGTGTIGLCLASRVKRVLAFELNEEAIKDAKYNAQLNNCNNVEFYCGRAENQLMPILESISASAENLNDFVAILNPPRNGLRKSK